MPHNRYFVDTPLKEKQLLNLAGEEYHHLVRVLRARPGDQIELVNGRNQLAYSKVVEISKQSAELTIETVHESSSSSSSLILAMGLPRMNHLEWILEKGTELGVNHFWLFPALLSEKDTLNSSQQARARHLMVSAMKQCGRLDLPSMEIKPQLLQWPLLEGSLFFGDLSEEAPYFWDLPHHKPLASPVIWFIGPEKGFDPKERHFLLHVLKAKGTRLHPNILRAETAPLTALSLTQQFI